MDIKQRDKLAKKVIFELQVFTEDLTELLQADAAFMKKFLDEIEQQKKPQKAAKNAKHTPKKK